MALSKTKIKTMLQDTLIKFYTDIFKPDLDNHTHKYAGSSTVGGPATSANKVNNKLTLQLNGTTSKTYNGSSAQTFNVTPSGIGAASSNHTHSEYINPSCYGSLGVNDNYINASSSEDTLSFSSGDGISLELSSLDPSESTITIINSGVRSITTGTSNGTISVNTNGDSANVAVKGLGSAAYTNSSNYATSSHTHNYAGSSTAGGSATSANKVNNSLIIQGNGTSLGSFDGSAAKTVNITPSNIGAVSSYDYDKFIENNISYISVLDYGVLNNGTDCTTIIESLIEDGYKNLYFPEGTYLFNISITKTNINIIGASKTGTIFTPYQDNKPVIELNSTNGNIFNCCFSNFTIYNNSSFTNTEAITFTGTNENDRHIFKNIIIDNGFLHSISILGRAIWNLFENIWIVGSLHSGIYMPGGDTKNLNTFNNITIRDGKKYAVFFSVYQGGTDPNFTYKSNIFLNCNFENNCLDTTVANQAALYFYNIDNTSLINCYIENNKNDSSTCYGIMSNGKYTRAINIIGCLIWGQDYGVKINSIAMSGLITGNRMANNTKDIEIGDSTRAGTGNNETNLKIGGNTLKHQINRIADINKNSFISTINPFSYPYRHANNTSTPDVKNCNIVMCWTTESITNFLNGIDGQIVTLRFYGSTSTKTISNGDYIKLRTSDSIVLSDGDTITFIYFDGVWVEISRSITKIPIPESGSWFKGFAKVNTDGVMEVGKYIDFHNTNDTTSDYNTRITCNNSGTNTLTLPTSSGTIALTSDIDTAIGNINALLDELNGTSV